MPFHGLQDAENRLHNPSPLTEQEIRDLMECVEAHATRNPCRRIPSTMSRM